MKLMRVVMMAKLACEVNSIPRLDAGPSECSGWNAVEEPYEYGKVTLQFTIAFADDTR